MNILKNKRLLFLVALLTFLNNFAFCRIDDVIMPTNLGKTWVEQDSQIYGARPDKRGSIGGGEGYRNILITGDYIVSSLEQLSKALKKSKSGEIIYIQESAEIDCTALIFTEKFVIKIPEGVTLASNRGYGSSRGALIYSDAFVTQPLIRTLGPNVRITGLRIQGPDPKKRLLHHKRAYNDPLKKDRKTKSSYYYSFPTTHGVSSKFSGLEVENCELSGWAHSAIHLENSKDNYIHHCFIHHNQRNGLGYGVVHTQAESLIEYNLFNDNRHSIAASGRPNEGYEARYNVEIQNSVSHNFDMHGGKDRRDGTDIAGNWIRIHHNTFRNKAVRAIAIRGIPRKQAEIYNNWFFHEKLDVNVILPWPILEKNHIHFGNNLFGQKNPVLISSQNEM